MSDMGDGFESTGCATELHGVCGVPELCACACHQPADSAAELFQRVTWSPSDPPAYPRGSEGDSAGWTETLRPVLLAHHPIMRSEDGPFSGCRCGQVRLGEDVIAHVAEQIRVTLDGEQVRR